MTDQPSTARLVVVSNRVADDRPPAGGLVFALHDCLSREGGLWIGSAQDTSETPRDHLDPKSGAAYDRYLFDMTAAEHAQFYLGYSNSVLWPLCHGRTDLMDMKPGNYEGYRAVNARMADQMAEVLAPDDVIWIHDYHFLPLAYELRARGISNRIGFFLHIPFPAGHDLTAISEWKDLLEWLAAFDLVGLQTERDVAQMIASVRLHPDCELLMNGRLRVGARHVAVRAFPIGIDADDFAKAAQSDATPPQLTLREGEQLIIGVDRLDYSKGLPQRFDGFAHYLDQRGDGDARASLLQIAPASRGDVVAYQEIRAELEGKSGAINGAHASMDWTPIRYISQHVPRETLAQLYRRADVALVTPLIDGMNLVAKEFVAAQDTEDPGVLVLSKLAGAAEQLTDAVLINPYDPSDIAQALKTALNMPLEERRARYDSMAKRVFDEDVHWWTQQILGQLRGAEPQPSVEEFMEDQRGQGA